MNRHEQDYTLEERLARSGLKGHPGATAAAAAAALSGDENLLNRLVQLLDVHAVMNMAEDHAFVLNQPEPEDLPAEGIPWVWTLRNDGSAFPCPLPTEQDWNACLLGTTGVGKSYGVKHLATQLHLAGESVWIFDVENEHADVAVQFPAEEFLVIDYQQLKRNIFQPVPGESPKEAIHRCRSVWRESCFLRDGSENMLGDILWREYENRGVFRGSRNYLTLADVCTDLTRKKYRTRSREFAYWETLMNRTTSLEQLLGEPYDCVEGFDLSELVGKSMVLRLRGMADQLRLFFLNDLITAALTCQALRPGNTLTIVIEEAHLTYSAWERRSDLAEPCILQAARRARKRDTRLVWVDQVPAAMPPQVLATTRAKTIFRLEDGDSKRTVARSCSLTREQEEYLSEIPERCAVQFLGGLYPKAFLVRFPELNFIQPTEAELARRMRLVLAGLRYMPRPQQPSPPTQKVVAKTTPKVEVKRQPAQKEPTASSLTRDAIDYLIEIAKHPFETVTERDARLGHSGYMGARLRDELAERGLVEPCRVNTGRRGGTIVLYQPTATGWRHLKSVLRVQVDRPRGKGGPEHQYWQHQAAAWCRSRFPDSEIVIEDHRLGKAVDVAVYLPDSRKIAMEIALGTAEKQLFEVGNIEANLGVGYDQVIVAARTEKDLDRIRRTVVQELGEDAASRIEWRRLREFLEQSDNGAAEVLSDQQSLDLSTPTTPKVIVKTKNESGL